MVLYSKSASGRVRQLKLPFRLTACAALQTLKREALTGRLGSIPPPTQTAPPTHSVVQTVLIRLTPKDTMGSAKAWSSDTTGSGFGRQPDKHGSNLAYPVDCQFAAPSVFFGSQVGREVNSRAKNRWFRSAPRQFRLVLGAAIQVAASFGTWLAINRIGKVQTYPQTAHQSAGRRWGSGIYGGWPSSVARGSPPWR